MREPAEVLLRRRGQGDGFDAGGEGRDDVHDHGGRVDGQAAGDVEAHARHGHPVLADHGAFAEFDVGVRRALRVGKAPGAPDGLFQGRPHGGIEPGQGRRQRFGGDPGVRLLHAVEGPGELAERVEAPGADGVDDVQDLLLGISHGAGLRAGNSGAEAGEGEPLAAQVDGAEVESAGPGRSNGGHGAVS